MLQSNVVTSIWDLVDLNLNTSLDRIQGLGASGVTVIATSGPVAELRSSDDATPRLFRSRGGFFFQPDIDRYEDTRLKPIVSTWLRNRNPLDDVVEGCRLRDLSLRLRISAFEVGRIAQRHPAAAAKNALGDVAPVTLCPANADVAALLKATIDDLAQRYSPEAIELHDLSYHSGTVGGSACVAFDAGSAFHSLLGICFSESSRQAASDRGSDAAAAARWVRIELNNILRAARPHPMDFETQIETSEALGEYVRAQGDILDALMAGIVGSATPASLRPPIGLVIPASIGAEILPSRAPGERGAYVVIPSRSGETGDVECEIRSGQDRFGPEARLEFELDAAGESAANPQRTISTCKLAADHGVHAVSFAHYGQLADDAMTTIKQAIRYASRSSG